MATENKKAKAHALLRKNEPEIRMTNYDADMLVALNYYNVNSDAKTKVSWFKAHFGKKIDFPLTGISDFYFRTIGTLCRIKDNGNQLSSRDEQRLIDEFNSVRERALKKETIVEAPVKAVVQTATIQDRMASLASDFMAEFNGAVDTFVETGTHPKIDNLVTSMGLRGPAIKMVKDKIQRVKQELSDTVAGKDKILNEAYSNFSRPELKKLLNMYETLDKALGQAKVVVAKKARVVKEKPAAQVAKHVKFNPENKELGLTSVQPAKIVGATEAWLFNTKTRRMMFYKAVEGMRLTIKGTTIVNFDMDASTQKTIRKPETVAATNGLGTRAYNKFFKETKSTPGKNNGRINADCVILATF